MNAEPDAAFFARHPARNYRIRPVAALEAVAEFRALGDHDRERRRMIVVRVPDGLHAGTLMPIPFLLFADETIDDSDETLAPIVREIMEDARGEPH